jgi:hypothetical protein
VQVLAGVPDVHDLGGHGELAASDAPDQGRAVAEDGELADVAAAAADALGLHQVRRTRACSLSGSGEGAAAPASGK